MPYLLPEVTGGENTEFHCNVGGLLESGLWTDATIECHGDIFRVHKAVICSQSAYFAKAFDPKTGFKVLQRPPDPQTLKSHHEAEAHTSTIILHDVYPDTVRAILQYLYHGKWLSPDSEDEQLVQTVDIYAAAEMYQLASVKYKALNQFRTLAPRMFALQTFPSAVQTICENTSEKDLMRNILVRTSLLKFDELQKNATFNDTLSQVAEFGKELVHGMGRQLLSNQSHVVIKCPKADCRKEKTIPTEHLTSDGAIRCPTCFYYTAGRAWEQVRKGIRPPDGMTEAQWLSGYGPT
ncbi:BTB/POZ protein [Phyllosticta capitalensis]|uniref:BTB/POZ protein n=1 Tax=Phyllosticta capitalensis TaxID=121624 RepID=UPI003131515A